VGNGSSSSLPLAAAATAEDEDYYPDVRVSKSPYKQKSHALDDQKSFDRFNVLTETDP
jgi:hypothetical protein